MVEKISNLNVFILNKNIIYLFLFMILININTINSCYITNCPWGGKRSLSDMETVVRECRKCASGLGTCFGPRICCGADIGCLIDTKESSVCRFEDLKSSVPCVPYGKTCDKVEFGKCATSNLCCNPDHCLEDSKCSQEEEESQNDLDQDELDRKLVIALNKLLSKKKEHKKEMSNNRQLKIENDK